MKPYGETPAEPPLPRADEGAVEREPVIAAEGFAIRDASIRGLSIPFYMLLLYLFIGLTMFDEEWPRLGALRPRLLLGSLLVLAVLVRIIRGVSRPGGKLSPPDAVTGWWGAFVLASLFATIWAFDTSLAVERMLDAGFPALFSYVLIVALVSTRREFLVLILLFCGAHGLYLLRAFTEFFAGRHVYTMGVIRMVGPGESNADPNSFAATIIFAMPLIIWAGMNTRSWWVRAGAAAYSVLGAWAVLLTRSRAGVILLALTALWTILSLKSAKARTWGVILLIVLAAIGVTQLSESARNRYLGMLTGEGTEDEKESAAGRIEGLQVGLRIFRENPVTGVGPGNWSTYRMRRVDGIVMLPHNLVGQVLATLGLLGAFTFGGYLLATFLRGFRARGELKGSPDPWAASTRAFAGAMLFTLVLHLVAGLAAHNLERWSWYWVPGLLVAAVTTARTVGSRS